MRLDMLTEFDMPHVVNWRNAERNVLRTPHFINYDMQDRFYEEVVNARNSKHRYFALVIDSDDEYSYYERERELIGMGGLTNIE